jgi:hypothetical protein
VALVATGHIIKSSRSYSYSPVAHNRSKFMPTDFLAVRPSYRQGFLLFVLVCDVLLPGEGLCVGNPSAVQRNALLMKTVILMFRMKTKNWSTLIVYAMNNG